MKRLSAFCFLLFLISGCLVAPPHESIRYGCGPYPSNYEAMIRDYLKYELKHPESLKDFSVIKPPEKITLDTYYAFIPLHKGHQVWECFVVYNAKNDEGVYVGNDLHVVWIRFNRIVAFDYKDTDLEYRIDERIKNPGY